MSIPLGRPPHVLWFAKNEETFFSEKLFEMSRFQTVLNTEVLKNVTLRLTRAELERAISLVPNIVRATVCLCVNAGWQQRSVYCTGGVSQ